MAWIAVILFSFLPAILALLSLRRRRLHEIAVALWVIVIVVLPLLGPVAFFLVNPQAREDTPVRPELDEG